MQRIYIFNCLLSKSVAVGTGYGIKLSQYYYYTITFQVYKVANNHKVFKKLHFIKVICLFLLLDSRSNNSFSV